MESRHTMSTREEVASRRGDVQKRIRMALNAAKAEERATIKGGETTVAFVTEAQCIGCDQCTIVCDDDAIELYDKAMTSPLIKVDINRKAKILRDPCTGCRLCVLACPTDAISMIDR